MQKIIKVLTNEGLIISLSEGRRLIHQGAVQIDGKTISNPEEDLDDKEHTVKIGKKITKTIQKYTHSQTG